MESVVLVIHLILALAIIGLVLLQRSEGGGLGIGGGGGGLGGFASARGTANALTKMTALCALGFFITSLTLGVLANQHSKQTAGLLENIDPSQIEVPVPEENNDVNAPVGVTYTPPSEINAPTENLQKSETPEDNAEKKSEKPKKPKDEPSAPTE